MSLKSRLRISIVALVSLIVVGVSALYLDDFASLAFERAASRADFVSKQVASFLSLRLQERAEFSSAVLPSTHGAAPDLAELLGTQISTDPGVAKMLERSVTNADTVVSVSISDTKGTILAASSQYLVGTKAPSGPGFPSIERRYSLFNLWDMETRPEDYVDVRTMAAGGRPLFRITVVVSATLMRAALRTTLHKMLGAFLGSLAVAMVLAYFLTGLVVGPIERLSEQIDSIRSGEEAAPAGKKKVETREFAVVQSKLNLLGEQYRGAQQDAVAIRRNVREMLRRLEEAVLLFGPEARLTMASPAAERMLGKKAADLTGMRIEELFPFHTMLGRTIEEGLRTPEGLTDRPLFIEAVGGERTRVLVNVQNLRREAGQDTVGTLVTLRDADTRRQLELQIDVSNRLAAISRLTGGVAHEIKNPLNAMALHLEVLKSKLAPEDPEIEVISKEIKRLDRVVKTFLSFNKPVELRAKPMDLSDLGKEVANLIGPEARLNAVRVETSFSTPCWINGDPDLLKQALLNLVVNSVEAMDGSGGVLRIQTKGSAEECQIDVSDTGPGIPAEIQDKIFNLYFSTKSKGSGIGLAMTFRVVQLHSGTIELSSAAGEGTCFHLRFPALGVYEEEVSNRAHQ